MMKNNGVCYCFIEEQGGDYALTFSTVKKGIHTGLEIGIIDFKKKEKLECSEYILNSRINRLSSFSVKSKNISLSLENNVNEKILKAKFEKCLSHTELKAELRLFPVSFGLSYDDESIGFAGACGEVLIKGRKYTFENGSRGVYFTSYGVPKSGRLIGFEKSEDGVTAVSASSGKNGRLIVLKNGESRSFEDFKVSEGEFGKMWNINAKGGVKLSFAPLFNDRVDVSRPWLNLHGNLFYGNLSGSVPFNESECIACNVKCLYGVADR